MLPEKRKSVEPMAARDGSSATAAQHQSLLHFVANAAWSDETCWPRCARWCCRRSRRADRSRRRIIDDTSFRQARQAFGRRAPPISRSARQAGQLPRWRCRCRLPIMQPAFRWPIGCILPEAWTKDRCAAEEGRRAEADQVQDQSSSDRAGRRSAGPARAVMPCGVALHGMTAYGRDARLRAAHDELGVPYVGRHRADRSSMWARWTAARLAAWTSR